MSDAQTTQPLARLCTAFSGHRRIASGTLVEVALAVWRASQDTAPLPLVFATIRRRAIDLARREDRRASREQTAAVDESQPWFDTGVADREFSRVIQRALAELPAEQREVITLKIWSELTFAEIGEVLAIPANTAASRYRYGLTELRKLTRQVLT